MKTCTKCGEIKLFSDFGMKSSSKDGLATHCKVCRRIDCAKYRSDNVQKIKAGQDRYRASNKEVLKDRKAKYYIKNSANLKAKSLAWYKKNKDKAAIYSIIRYGKNADKIKASSNAYRIKHAAKVKEYQTYYREANAEKAKDYHAKWSRLNSDLMKMYRRNRRARLYKNGGRLTVNLERKLFQMQRGKCACCQLPLGDDYHMDHIMPLALGGSNTDDNIQLLRAKCNLQKSAKHPVDFMQERGYLL